jgi:hypothetical protein
MLFTITEMLFTKCYLHLKACFFTHLYLANTHLKVCKNTHLFRKIHTLSCVKKHALRCVNLATEGVLKIHTLFFRVLFKEALA